jgi:hypothetical protein
MTQPEHIKYTILREIVRDPEDVVVGLKMIFKASKAIETAYIHGTQRLDLHVPIEDEHIQHQLGGTPDHPVLLAMITADGNIIRAMTCHYEHRYFDQFARSVIPLFTSPERLQRFVDTLTANRYIVPIGSVTRFLFDRDIECAISDGEVMVNPISEIFMGTCPAYVEDANGETSLVLLTPESASGFPPVEKTSRDDGAVREAQNMVRQYPDVYHGHLALGIAYHRAGRIDEAVVEYRAAIDLIPVVMWMDPPMVMALDKDHARESLITAHLNLGTIYEQLGNLDDAIREYQVAAQLGSHKARTVLAERGLM